MASSDRANKDLGRRLKELRKERELLREDIRTLSRVLKSEEPVQALPKLKSESAREARVVPPQRRDPVKAARPLPPPPPEPQPPRMTPETAAGAMGDPRKTAAVSNDERFANYFSSGGFLGKHVPLRQERSVQRNKAIFMIVVVIVVAFIVYQHVVR